MGVMHYVSVKKMEQYAIIVFVLQFQSPGLEHNLYFGGEM